MLVPIPSQYRAFKLRLVVEAAEPLDLVVQVFDPAKINTDYIRRRVPFKSYLWERGRQAIKSFSLPFPRSPKQLTLELYNHVTGDNQGFRVLKMEPEDLTVYDNWEQPDVHRFATFAQRFAEIAGYSDPGFYDSENGEYLIEYVPEITDQFGRPQPTPARVSRSTGRIQVSAKQFRRYTIPVRLFILLHEKYHRVLNTRRERPPDKKAIQYFLNLGYPGLEGHYAASKVFREQPGNLNREAFDRVVAIDREIRKFQARTNSSKTNQVV